MNANDFDMDFDFEKEYGSEPAKDEPASEPEDEFDLRDILGANYEDASDSSGISADDGEYGGNFDYSNYPIEPEEEDDPAGQNEFVGSEEEHPILAPDDVQPYTQENRPYTKPNDPQPQGRRPHGGDDVPRERQSVSAKRQNAPRKKPVSPSRRFKNDVLPRIITGGAAVLILIFVIGAISRAVRKGKSSASLQSTEATSSASNQQSEVTALLAEAEALAQGYDYDGAIEKLSSYTGSADKQTVTAKLGEYQQAKSALVAHTDPSAIPNLSFNVLIADPSRAFSDKSLGKKYNQNFVTIDEFEKILDQLYENNYVLVDMDSFIAETQTDASGSVTYSSKELYLPEGKKPVMITETMVNYFTYMVDSDGDGEPDKGGAGFASKLVLQNGEIKAEMVNASGETVVGDYDLVPILEAFIAEHPDFCYRGSRATLAVCGYDGVFGYRTNASVVTSKGQDYYTEQVDGAKEIAKALTDAGYEIACYTYGNVDYGELSATKIQADLASWTKEVTPILGTIDTLVFARSSDISTTGAYTGGKFNALQAAGFRYFISSGTSSALTIGSNYVRQVRIEVKGTNMAHSASMYASYFDASTVLNSLRGDVPTS